MLLSSAMFDWNCPTSSLQVLGGESPFPDAQSTLIWQPILCLPVEVFLELRIFFVFS